MTAHLVSSARDQLAGPLRLRAPEVVLRLERLGSFHQTRLSFMRVLLRRLAREGWRFEKVLFDIDVRGQGIAIYEAHGNGRVYSLVAFGHDLDPAKRTDRVIAEEWDATFALHDGVVSRTDIERLSRNVPKQEAGRCTASELVMARANRSVRLFDHIVATLAEGRQPAPSELDAVGYLMRTTAVYGSGKFGLADREKISERPEFAGPFSVEMLTVWLIRAFTVDVVEHMARLKAPDTAVPLDRALRRRLGVGNSTGLGMAPFLVNHPGLFHRWIQAREMALARVCAIASAGDEAVVIFRDRLARAAVQVDDWRVDDVVQTARIEGLRRDLVALSRHVGQADLTARYAWRHLFGFAERELGLEAQELLVTLLLEPYGELVDDLAAEMGGDEAPDFHIDGAQTVGSLRDQVRLFYPHALGVDFTQPDARARFWYVSEEKLEPRLGERNEEGGADREQPLAVSRDVAALHHLLQQQPAQASVADFLSQHPECRHCVRRVQLTARRPYAEIRDNLIASTMRPVDILRCKLSFFGATDFDPRSDRWVRISMFRHAPFPDELNATAPDDWAIPPLYAGADPVRLSAPSPSWSASWLPAPDVPRRAGFSLNEIEATVKKAARGAGLPWGLAEEAGRYARELAPDAPACLPKLADALRAMHEGRHAWHLEPLGNRLCSQDNRPLSPLAVGPAIADRVGALEAGCSLTIHGGIAVVCLLAPPLSGLAARTGRLVRIDAANRSALIGTDLARAAVELATLGGDNIEELRITLTEKAVPGGSPGPCAPGGIEIDGCLWQRFNALAALTYVPASEQSRLAGAGAGLSDND